ncbi:MAG: TnsA endonuclease N-terminal domain-containing protein [Chlorobi bacterium]|nr:TnsA endonuclease N-terminal domain-containing protein [Chlorobiota bacterium]MCI0714984.1 TnsA endonuclease N-terminal domain-containing protein [Chlorobiota bacterium]
MAGSERGDFENPKKSAYSVERYDSDWERQYMLQLEKDKMVLKWTKIHGINIEYITEAGNKRGYRPDFLVQKVNGDVELHEVKGGQFIDNPDTKRKFEAAKNWCGKRNMKFIVITKKK